MWFGLTFYDGEGYSGVGGIGWFDPDSRNTEMIYPPALAAWSVTAIAGHDEAILVELAQYGEGATGRGGIWRYDILTGDFRKIVQIPGLIGHLAMHKGSIYALSNKGLFTYDGEYLTHFRLIPDRREGAVRVLVSQHSTREFN